jgi:ABC-2 type transport system ATP-binding protein
MKKIVDVKKLRKEYGPLVAVKDVSFTIERGQVVGLIGPNGAGKTTLLKMLATLLEPTDGAIQILGFDAEKEYLNIREHLGYLPDFFGLYDDLTITECLAFFARTYNIPPERIRDKVDAVLQYIDLTDKRHDFIQHLSRGMIQRLGIGVLLVHEPDLFLLDEPASGLDPKARIDLRKVLTRLSQEGKTVMISSHILTELSDFCTHVIMMDHGKFLAHGPIDEILRHAEGVRRVKITILDQISEAEAFIQSLPYGEVIERAHQTLTVGMPDDMERIAMLNTALIERGFKVVAFYEEKTNLEDMFLKIANTNYVQ